MNRHNSLKKTTGPLQQYNDPMTRVDPFQKYPDVFKQIIDWSKDPMVRPENQNKYFFSDGKTYYEQICKMLKLMSVFKDAFQQIYDNEDEIHEAWNNFVDNLTATAEYGEEVGVTLTWTEESVNFDFTIPGGADGTGIQSIVFNADYTMTITLTDGTTYTSPSLRGETGATGATGPQGPAGPQGPQGDGLHILDVYPTLADLQQAHPTGQPGDAYEVGTAPTFTLYIWSTSQNAWVPAGSLGSVSPSNTNPLMDGTASPGVSAYYSRGDHVHPTDTSRASQSDLNTVSGNLSTLSGQVSDIATAVDIVEDMVDDLSDIVQVSQSLIDQQFLYRESLADHDTIGKLDNIKGNSIVFNQLVQNGNFADTSSWSADNMTFSVSENIATLLASARYGNIRQQTLFINGHKYFYKAELKISNYNANNTQGIDLRWNSVSHVVSASNTNEWQKLSSIVESNYTGQGQARVVDNRVSEWTNILVKNYIVMDLTLMGIDNLTTTAEVEAWLSSHIGNLPYYDYTQGKLLPFKGESLKTTGKNLLPIDLAYMKSRNTSGTWNENVYTYRGITFTINGDGTITANGTCNGGASTLSIINYNDFTTDFAKSVLGKTIILNGCPQRTGNPYTIMFNTWGTTNSIYDNGRDVAQLSVPSTVSGLRCDIEVYNGSTLNNIVFKPMIRYADVQDATFEPYTSSTINLPTLTYFSSGMKSAGSVYDELTESKAITRVGSVDLGTLTWNYASNLHLFYASVEGARYAGGSSTIGYDCKCALYKSVGGKAWTNFDNLDITVGTNTIGNGKPCVNIRDDDFSDTTSFKNHVTGQDLYFELATSTEQSILPALDMTFKAWKGGTEQILPENTSDPYTAPIRTDMTYMSTDEAVLYLKDHAVTDPTVIDSYYSIQTYTFAPQIIPYPADSNTVTNVNAVTIPGYRPIGVIGWDFYNLSSDTPPQRTNASSMVLERAYYLHSTGRIYVTFANKANYAQTNPRLDLYVLYMKVNGGN